MKKVLYITAIAAALDLSAMINIPNRSGYETITTTIATQIAPLASVLSKEEYKKLLDISKALKKSEKDVEKKKNALDKAVANVNETRDELASAKNTDIPKVKEHINAIRKYKDAHENHGIATAIKHSLQDSLLEVSSEVGFRVAFDEVLGKVSRPPNGSEDPAISNLKSLLGLEDKDEIRIMDAKSLICGMGFKKDEELQFLVFLDAEKGNEKVLEYIEEYLNEKCTYTDGHLNHDALFKKRVMEDILEGCKNSKTYKDNFITLIARTTMPQPFFSKIMFDLCARRPQSSTSQNKGLNFVRGEISESNYNEIILDDKEHYFQSLSDEPSKIKSFNNGFHYYLSPKNHIVFHELGHSVSGVFARFASYASTMDIVYELITRSINEKSDLFYDISSELLETIEENPEDYATLHEAPEKTFLNFSRDYLEYEKPVPVELRAPALALNQSSKEIAIDMYCRTPEVLQIMGLMVLENNGKKVLCINLLSDLALALELGLPPRWGHVAPDANIYNTTDFITHSKTATYDALCNVFHCSRIGGIQVS